MKNTRYIIKENYKLFLGILAFGIIVGLVIGKSSHHHINQSSNQPIIESTTQTWTCSMHPQIKQDKPGKCPICAMDLVTIKTMQAEGDDVAPNEIAMTEAAAKLADIQTVIVSKGKPHKTVYLQGKVQPDERNIAELTARFGGRIEKLFVNFTGQNVKKRQKLATIYSPNLVTAQKELLEALNYKSTRPSLYAAARGKLKLWDLSDEQIKAIEKEGKPQLYFDVLSPITGTVTMRHITNGDYVKEGTALFKVIDLKRIWVMFDAYESDLPWIQIGDSLNFNIQSLPGKNFKAKVNYIDPFINKTTRVAKIRVELNNPDFKLKPEMFANGLLKSGIAGNSEEILIPKSSILWTGKRAIVYVKVPKRETPSFLYREIVLGPEAENFYVVKEGLHEGEEIATNGVFKIDAAAQLAGLSSMMNPQRGITPTGHDHNQMSGHKIQDRSKPTHQMFKVAGNCGMCKDRIESAAKSVMGVISAQWESETQMLHLHFDTEKTGADEVKKAIAKAGHDTEKFKADDSVYNELPGCCLYERLK